MKKLLLIILCGICASSLIAQSSLISNNKPLAFFNPALQNTEIEKGIVSASYIVNPYIQDVNPANYQAIAEFKLNENFRLGVHSSKVENRLNKNQSAKVYGSYRLEMDKGNYLLVGVEAGGYSDLIKTGEFSKVYSPNRFTYSDTVAQGLDLGVGFAYSYNGLTAGMSFSKLNKPDIVPFPSPVLGWVYMGNDSSFVLLDTNVMDKPEKVKFGLGSNLNVMYEWKAGEKVKVIHSLHFGNIDLTGADYTGFQNFIILNNRHSLGLGVYTNGYTGYYTSLGIGITESIKIEGTAIFSEDLNWDVVADNY
ncbi:MAG: hypothetical protein RLZZ337_796, partial [Bacteroidota bacterium]